MLERLRTIINYLVFQGIIKNDTDLADKIGYKKTSLSSILNGSVPAKKFVERLCRFHKNLNKVWILTGEGSMLNSDGFQSNNTNSTNVNGTLENSPITVNNDKTLEKALDALRESQGQINRLITIIENMQK